MHDLIIIGAGPAGLTAALYAGRFKLNTRIFERISCGGQILLSPAIENYPGFPGGISTFDLIDKFKKQVEDLGLEIENQSVLEIIPEGKFYNVKTESGVFKTKTVIVASGAASKRIGVKGEDKFIGKGVSYCGTCDGPLFKNKDIVVVGGGDRAVEDAIFLANYAKRVYLVHRRSEFRASQILVDKAKTTPKIKFILEFVVEEIIGGNKVEQVRIKNVKTSVESNLFCQGVFILAGINPNTEFIKNILEINEAGFIIIDRRMHTSKEGIFACGDCVEKGLYQVISACSDGAAAADSAHKYLLKS
ncbi:MAG: thioredoxin-disulfide reductase [Candidatus Omnitrophica bacterium CG08_land_8_20_14_0_20_41_16]|nr:MAG: thioredoxin-disulfide reductase [Candidatus Omnitrophica bacterium CG08_land_8_20_14_0_20_41_16]